MPIPAPKLSPAEPVPFTEAIDWFGQQAPWISGSSWSTMAGLAAEKGDQVSSTILLTMLDDVWTQMDKAMVEGLPYGDFVRNVGEHLDRNWYDVDSPRLKLIYHNNVGNALMAGRYAQAEDPDVMEARPWWLFDGIADFRQSPICLVRDGIVLPADDPWWKANKPLLHHRCRSGIITLDAEDAKEFGGQTPASKLVGLLPAQKGWGKPASWIDWKPKPEDYHALLAAEYQKWTSGQDYIHEKGEWDAKWHRVAAMQAFQKRAAEAAESLSVKLKADEATLNAPFGNVEWGKDPKYDGLALNGVKIQPAPDGYWTGIKDVVTGEPEIPTNLGKVSSGIIVMEDDGRIWVVEPKDHFGGYVNTMPKGKLEPGLSAQQNALKELYEEAGLSAEITGYVGDFKGTTGVSRYYLAKRTGGQPWTAHWESQAVKLVTVQDALDTKLNTERDKEIVVVLLAKHAGLEPPAGLKTYVAPVKVQPAIVSQPVAAPATFIPQPAKTEGMPFGLDPSKFAYVASKPGGSTPGTIVAHPDAPGQTFMLKRLQDDFKAEAEVTGGALYGLVNDDVVTVEMADPALVPKSLSANFVTVQKMEPGTVGLTSVIGYKGHPDFTALSTDQQADLIAHGVASWIAGEHDGHAEQYLLKGGKLLRIDLGQALKYTLTTGDKLDMDYHPNEMYGEARPAHMQLLKAIQAGTIDASVLHHPKIKAAVERAGKLTEGQIEKALGKYGDLHRGGRTKAEIVGLLKERAVGAKADWAKLFEKVTGKKFEWEASVKPKAQPKPEEPKQARAKPSDAAPKIQQGVALPKIDKQLETFGAVTVAADGDKLRGQAWRVQKSERVNNRNSEPVYTFTGELDQSVWSDVENTLRKRGAESKAWETFPRVGLFDAGDTAKRPVKQLDVRKSSSFLGNAMVYSDPDMTYQVTFGDSSAKTIQRGQVKIEVFSGDAAEAQELFRRALAATGLDKHKLDAKPTPDQARVAAMNRALWNIQGGEFVPNQDIEHLKEELDSHKIGESDLGVAHNSLGYSEPRINGRWQKYRKDGARFLYHQFRPEANPLKGISGADGGKGGVLSTVARSENGIVIGGMSSSTDLETGGASSAFTRLVGKPGTSSGSDWYSEHNYTAILSPKILDRTDFYGYNSDSFGRTNDSGFKQREGADDLVKKIANQGSSSNELMFRNAVAREDILFFAAPSQQKRLEMIVVLANAGVTTIRGQSIMEMVVVMTTPSDMSRLNEKNPVHAFLMGKRETYPDWSEKYGGSNE